MYRYIKGYISGSGGKIKCILKGVKGKGGGGGFFEVIILLSIWSLLHIYMEAWQNIQYSI